MSSLVWLLEDPLVEDETGIIPSLLTLLVGWLGALNRISLNLLTSKVIRIDVNVPHFTEISLVKLCSKKWTLRSKGLEGLMLENEMQGMCKNAKAWHLPPSSFGT